MQVPAPAIRLFTIIVRSIGVAHLPQPLFHLGRRFPREGYRHDLRELYTLCFQQMQNALDQHHRLAGSRTRAHAEVCANGLNGLLLF